MTDSLYCVSDPFIHSVLDLKLKRRFENSEVMHTINFLDLQSPLFLILFGRFVKFIESTGRVKTVLRKAVLVFHSNNSRLVLLKLYGQTNRFRSEWIRAVSNDLASRTALAIQIKCVDH